MRKILGLTIFAVIFTASCSVLGEKKDDLTDIGEIKREYKKSADEARKKFEGKELTVLGTVIYRSESISRLKLGTRADSSLSDTPDINCFFDESDVMFKNVEENDTVKIKGSLKITDSEIEMKPCKFAPL
jgi:hypothetical protein